MDELSPLELFEAGGPPPDDPRRTCRRCGKTPMRGSWWCVFHEDKQSTELEPQMRPASLARWRQYWEGGPRPERASRFDGPV
jgi:hypothetical protein